MCLLLLRWLDVPDRLLLWRLVISGLLSLCRHGRLSLRLLIEDSLLNLLLLLRPLLNRRLYSDNVKGNFGNLILYPSTVSKRVLMRVVKSVAQVSQLRLLVRADANLRELQSNMRGRSTARQRRDNIVDHLLKLGTVECGVFEASLADHKLVQDAAFELTDLDLLTLLYCLRLLKLEVDSQTPELKDLVY